MKELIGEPNQHQLRAKIQNLYLNILRIVFMFASAQLPEDEQSLITMITNFLVFALVSELIVLEPIHEQT